MMNFALLQNQTASNSPTTSFSSPIKMSMNNQSSQQNPLINLQSFSLNNLAMAPQQQDVLLSHINQLLIQKERQEQQQLQQKLLIDTLLNQIQAQQNQQIQEQRKKLLQQISVPTLNYLKSNEDISYSGSSMTSINMPQTNNYANEPKLSICSFPSCENIKREEDSYYSQALPQQQQANFFFPQQQLIQQQIQQQQQLLQQQLLNSANSQSFLLNPLVSELNMKRKLEELDSSSQSPICESSIHKKKLIVKNEEEHSINIKPNVFKVKSRNINTCSTLPNTPTLPIKQEEKDPKNRSRFHNLTKLFLNSLLSIFTRENLMRNQIPAIYQEDLIKCIARVKQSGRKTQGKVCKTDLFNHSHYNVLFLKLTPESIKEISTKPKDANIHKTCFDIDVSLPIPQFQIDHINTIKKYIYEVTQAVLGNPVESDSVRDEYWLRAMVGIKQLSEGKLIYRFQSISQNQQLENSVNKNSSNENDENN